MPIFPDASPEDLGWKTVNPGLYFTDKFVVARGLTGSEEKEYEEAHKKPKPEVGFVGGLTNEWGAVEIRKAYGYEEGLAQNTYVPTDEERWDALKQLGYNLDRYRAVLKGASSSEDFKSNLEVIKSVQEYRDAQGQEGLWNNLVSGTGAMFGDPLTALPVFGSSSAIGRIGYGAVMGVASGQLNNYSSGDDNDALMDMATGMAFGASIEGIARATKFKDDATKLGDASRRARMYSEKIASGAKDVFRKTGISEAIEKTQVHKAFNSALEKLEKKLPTITVQGAIDKVNTTGVAGQALRKIWANLGKTERGDRATLKQFNNAETTRTAEEARDFYRKEGERDIDTVADDILKLLDSTRMDADDLDEMIRRRRDGYVTDLDGNELFEEIVERMGAFYGKWGDMAQARGMIGEADAMRKLKETGDIEYGKSLSRSAVSNDKFESHWLSKSRVSDFLNTFTGSYEEKVKKARARVYKLLLRTLEDPEYTKLLRARYEEELAAKAKDTPAKGTDVKVSTDQEDFNAWVKKKAWDDSLGYVDQAESIKKGLMNNPKGEGMPHNYQHERTPWKFTIKDSDGFSVSRLQTNIVETMNGYNMRISGDMGLNDAFGVKSFKEFSDTMDARLSEYLKETTEDDRDLQAKAFRAYLSDYYGRSGMDNEDASSWGSAAADALRNFTLFTHNAFMGVLNHFEIAEGIKEFGASFFFKSIPGMPDKIKDWSKGGMTKQERNEFRDMAFGKEVRVRGAWSEIYERNIDKFGGDRYKARLVAGTQWLATNSPFTKYLNKSQETIVSTAQDLFIGQFTRHVHGAKGRVAFLDSKTLNRLNINPKDFADFARAFKDATEVDKWGRIRVKPDVYDSLIANDVKSMTIMRRLGDYVASEVIQRQSLTDAYMWRGSKKSPVLGLLTQFKSFAIRSYNKRFAKTALRLSEGDAAGQAMTWLISGALGTLSTLGQTFATASGMNDEQRERYFERVFGVSDLSDADWTTILNVCINGMSRSSILAMPSMLASLAGFNTGIKSTADQGYILNEEAEHVDMNKVLANIPAAQTLFALYNLQADTRNLFDAGVLNPDDYVDGDRERYAKSFGRSIKALTPNAPFIQQSLINYITDQEDN
jgi:hypothetical protein